MVAAALVLGLASGAVFVLMAGVLLLARPPRSGAAAFAVFAATIGLQLLAHDGAFVLSSPLLAGISWPLMGLAAVALLHAATSYAGRWRALVWPALAVAGAGALIALLRAEWLLYPDGGPNDLGVVLWQMPVYLASAVAGLLFVRAYQSAPSEELRLEGLLLVFAVLPHLAYNAGLHFALAAVSPEVVPTDSGSRLALWTWAYLLTFGAALLAIIVCAVRLWAGGERRARWLVLFTLLVAAAGVAQPFLVAQYATFGGALRILAALALAYGLLKFGLFGTDLHLKWSLDRGALLAVFGAVFFIVDQAAQYFVSSTFGVIAGFAAAVALLFVLKPLHRLTAKLADRIFPNVQSTPEYLESRKLTVYRSAALAAGKDGVVTERERRMLDVLARELQLTANELESVEREMAAAPRAA